MTDGPENDDYANEYDYILIKFNRSKNSPTESYIFSVPVMVNGQFIQDAANKELEKPPVSTFKLK